MNSVRVLLGSLLLTAGTLAHAAAVSLTSVPASVPIGSTFSVTASVNDAMDIYAFQLDLSYAKNLVQLDAVLEGAGFQSGGGFFAGADDPTTGVVSFVSNTLLGPASGLSGDLDLVTFVFKALGTGAAEFDLGNLVLLDSTLAEITPSGITGVQTLISDAGTVPEPGSALLVLAAACGLLMSHTFRVRSDKH